MKSATRNMQSAPDLYFELMQGQGFISKGIWNYIAASLLTFALAEAFSFPLPQDSSPNVGMHQLQSSSENSK